MDDGLTLQRCQHEESRAARIIRNTTLLFNRFIRYHGFIAAAQIATIKLNYSPCLTVSHVIMGNLQKRHSNDDKTKNPPESPHHQIIAEVWKADGSKPRRLSRSPQKNHDATSLQIVNAPIGEWSSVSSDWVGCQSPRQLTQWASRAFPNWKHCSGVSAVAMGAAEHVSGCLP